MKTAVRYFSRTGNTKKLAEAIGEAVGAQIATVDKRLDEPVEVLFLGAAIYAGKVDESIKTFIQNLSPDMAGKVVVFSTSLSSENAYSRVKDQILEKGIELYENTFHCQGKFLIFNRKRPNEQDMKSAAEFARDVIKA